MTANEIISLIFSIILTINIIEIINSRLFISQFIFWIIGDPKVEISLNTEKYFYKLNVILKSNSKTFNIVYDVFNRKISEDSDNLFISLTEKEKRLINLKIEKLVKKFHKKYLKEKYFNEENTIKQEIISFKRKYGIKELK